MNSPITYTAPDQFEQLYAQLCQKERRIYRDEEVAKFPVISKTHLYYKEWNRKKRGLKTLTHYLKRKGDELNILEIGCGNGWLAAQLASVTQGRVTGIDINETALKQAERVFCNIPNLSFIACDLGNECLQDNRFDIIVFAESIEYFCSLKKILTAASAYLTLQGEIHIMDSHFYKQSEIAAANQGAMEYFRSAGIPEMAKFYFHHCADDLKRFNHFFLHNPEAWVNKLSIHKNPFYHVVIKNRYQ